MPIDFGTHHRLNSSGLDQASNTMRARAANVRLTTTSRSDFFSIVVGFVSPCVSIDLLLLFHFLDTLAELIEARVPKLSVPFDPRALFFQPPHAELARAHSPDLLGRDEPRLLQDTDVLLHARQRHVKFLGQRRDRGVRAAELLENAAASGVRKRSKPRIKRTLNHLVQYLTCRKRRQPRDGHLHLAGTGAPTGCSRARSASS